MTDDVLPAAPGDPHRCSTLSGLSEPVRTPFEYIIKP